MDALYDREQRPWLVTIAHESEWFVQDLRVDTAELAAAFPRLKLR